LTKGDSVAADRVIRIVGVALVIVILAVLVFLALRIPTTGAVETQLNDTQGVPVGTVFLRETPIGLEIRAQVRRLEPGAHGIHIHERGQCEQPDFESAGEHFNPFGSEHGLDNPDGPHLGDMPNLPVSEAGVATNYQAGISPALSDLADSDGSALVIHANEDDQVTDPSGGSGDRVACAVIAPAV
jgi:Cu-Zn family superoxide dismutase